MFSQSLGGGFRYPLAIAQILEDEAIKVAALHLRGKAYAWWIFESFSLRNVNISSYANFTKALVENFDRRIHEIHMVILNKKTQIKA